MKCPINYSNDVFSDQTVQAVPLSTAQGSTASTSNSTSNQGNIQYVYVPVLNADNYKVLLIILVIVVLGLLFAIPRGDEA